jgi:MFS family permease
MSDLTSENRSAGSYVFSLPVLVAALGYMVDMYDLFLFSIVRVPSLKSLGLEESQLLGEGIFLLNLQMAGLLIGGIVWGIIGDKRGRLSVLFGSILIYSLANIGNGLVTTVDQYALLRFIAGFGLAGELGAGITLVAEILPKAIRGYGTTLVATMGVLGAILAYVITYLFEWRMSFFIGGGLGIVLLILRISVFESGMFEKLKVRNIKRGNLVMLFGNKVRLIKYMNSILIGLPIWFVTGILITFSPEFGKALGLSEPVDAGKAVMIFFTGQVLGDITSGFLSQYLKSRKKVILIFITMSFFFVMLYLLFPTRGLVLFYILCWCLGVCNGYWTLFVTVGAELFGTNLRATVATSVPNFVRGATIPMTMLFVIGKNNYGVAYGALIVAVIAYGIALLALRSLEETFSKDLDYTEEDN